MEKDKISEKEKKVADELVNNQATEQTCNVLTRCKGVKCDDLICPRLEIGGSCNALTCNLTS